MGVKREGGLLLKLSLGLIRERGFNRGFTILLLLDFCLSDVKKKSINPALITNF